MYTCVHNISSLAYHLFFPKNNFIFKVLGTCLIVNETLVSLVNWSPIRTPEHLSKFTTLSVITSSHRSAIPCKYTLYISSVTRIKLRRCSSIEHIYRSSNDDPPVYENKASIILNKIKLNMETSKASKY